MRLSVGESLTLMFSWLPLEGKACYQANTLRLSAGNAPITPKTKNQAMSVNGETVKTVPNIFSRQEDKIYEHTNDKSRNDNRRSQKAIY